jgi:hypothetical protein
MFGLDERIAASSNGASIWIVLAVAVLLGLRQTPRARALVRRSRDHSPDD